MEDMYFSNVLVMGEQLGVQTEYYRTLMCDPCDVRPARWLTQNMDRPSTTAHIWAHTKGTTMVHTYEFELFPTEGFLRAIPFDFDGEATGKDRAEASCEIIVLLRREIEKRLMNNSPMPEATFGNQPRHADGVILIASIDASVDAIDTVTASEAAITLGVSRARVSQMVKAGILEGYTKGNASFITCESVERRLKSNPRPGRPRKVAAVE